MFTNCEISQEKKKTRKKLPNRLKSTYVHKHSSQLWIASFRNVRLITRYGDKDRHVRYLRPLPYIRESPIRVFLTSRITCEHQHSDKLSKLSLFWPCKFISISLSHTSNQFKFSSRSVRISCNLCTLSLVKFNYLIELVNCLF